MTDRNPAARRFRFDCPQRIAAALLAIFLLLGLWLIAHNRLSASDYQYARCGADLWQSSPASGGAMTSCGDVHDGLLAYRLAGLPVALDLWQARLLDRLLDRLRGTKERSLSAEARGLRVRPSAGELHRHLPHMGLLLRLPFLLAGCLLGGCLWWVARRLYGNWGGYTALAFFFCSPSLLRAAVTPNAESLSALGIYGGFYTCIGVAHALQGPRRKWRSRIVLLATLLGLTAATHLLALAAVLLPSLPMMYWLALGRRQRILPIVAIALAGAAMILFACAGFSPHVFAALFGPAPLWAGLSAAPALDYFRSPVRIGFSLAVAAASLMYLCMRKARYFGNTAPLICAVLLLLLVSYGVQCEPWLWAQVFLISFVSGVFADAYETRYGRWAAAAAVALSCVQAVCCLLSLNAAG